MTVMFVIGQSLNQAMFASFGYDIRELGLIGIFAIAIAWVVILALPWGIILIIHAFYDNAAKKQEPPVSFNARQTRNENDSLSLTEILKRHKENPTYRE